MLRAYYPQFLLGEHRYERLICADVTRYGHIVFVHVITYPDFRIDASAIELGVGDTRFKGTAYGVPDTLAIAFDIPKALPDRTFELRVDGVARGRVTPRAFEPDEPVFLTAATLFKRDFRQVRAWIEYHQRLGFQRFVLYYNGKVDEILPELQAQPAIQAHDVMIVQWPFSYWMDGLPLGVEGWRATHGESADPARQGRDWHHAQQLMLNHALLFLRGTTTYVGFFDLDEYFRLESSGRLIDILDPAKFDAYTFQSRWAELQSDRVPGLTNGADFFQSETVVASPAWMPFPHHTKTIYKPEKWLCVGAHIPKAALAGSRLAQVPVTLAGLYHFHSFSGKASRRKMVNPSGHWVSIPHF
jgi:hypothetical protein